MIRRFAIARLRKFEHLVVLSAALFIAGLALVSILVGGDEVLTQLRLISPGVFAGLLALSLINYIARGCRWLLYAHRLGIDIPARRNLLYFFAGFSLTTTPGKIGEALRLWLLERGHGYPYFRVTPLFLGDRLSDMNGVLLLALAGVLGFPGQIWLTAAAGGLVLLITLAFVFPSPLIRAVTAGYDIGGRRGRRPFAKLRTMLRHTSLLFVPRVYLPASLLSAIGWAAEGLAFYWLLDELGTSLPMSYAFFIFAFSIIVGAVSMLPGGLGGAEAMMMALLVAVGVPFQTAVVATAVIRTTTLWFGVGLGFLALPAALRHVRRGAAGPALESAVRS